MTAISDGLAVGAVVALCRGDGTPTCAATVAARFGDQVVVHVATAAGPVPARYSAITRRLLGAGLAVDAWPAVQLLAPQAPAEPR